MPADEKKRNESGAESSPRKKKKDAGAAVKKTTPPPTKDGAGSSLNLKKKTPPPAPAKSEGPPKRMPSKRTESTTDSDEELKNNNKAPGANNKKDGEAAAAQKKQSPPKNKNAAEPTRDQQKEKEQPPSSPQMDVKLHVWDQLESDSYNYRLTEKLGAGGYGDVFEADARAKDGTGGKKQVAIKAALSRQTITIEEAALRDAASRECRRIPKIFDSGVFRNRPHNFVAMELKGRDLYQLRKERTSSKFSLATAVRVGIQTLEAIEELHGCGFISRDIKPGNFVTGLTHPGDDLHNVYLIDFGLCKRYRDQNGRVIPSRGEVGWRGTNRYGSLQAHRRLDLSRRDDMESWFYTLVELTKGHLPWATDRDRNAIYERKLAARRNVDQFIEGCPGEYKELLRMIDALGFDDTPDYAGMRKLLEQIIVSYKIDRNAPMDWEQDERHAELDGPEPGQSDTHSPTTQRRQRF